MGMTSIYSRPTDAAGVHSPNDRCCSQLAHYRFAGSGMLPFGKTGIIKPAELRDAEPLWINNWNWKNVQIDFKYAVADSAGLVRSGSLSAGG